MALSFIVYEGPHTNDFTALQGKLYDLEPGARRGLRFDLPQFAEVTLELQQGYPTAGANAGIPADVFEHFILCNSTINIIEEKLAIALKHVEVLEESKAFYVHSRQSDVALMVDSMRSRAERRNDSSILSPFEKTIAYYGQVGDKAAKTRKQNAAKAQEQIDAAADQAKLNEAKMAELDAYKTELDAKFEQAVAEALAKKLAEQKAPQGG